ncbi:MAG: 50S ribosomal protein L18 [Dehalococcoidia bacterium]|nr:50S ribosomal protein L18 [Dehalococcoidia bacterium]MSQ17604.1 50S ribosomal protein L18 [Dehalococcoidia bacterium]
MPKDRDARKLRTVRHLRVRKKVVGSPERPRLCVFRSLKFIYAQVIDDAKGHTLAYASSKETGGEGGTSVKPKLADSVAVGKLVAERARAQGVTQVVFDRGGYKYHGRVKALADAARAGGLEF